MSPLASAIRRWAASTATGTFRQSASVPIAERNSSFRGVLPTITMQSSRISPFEKCVDHKTDIGKFAVFFYSV